MNGAFLPLDSESDSDYYATSAANTSRRKEKQMIQVYAYQNPLKTVEGKDKYCFRSVVDQTLDNEQLIKEIIDYNSTITEADARAVLSVLNDRVKHFVNLGYKVELPFGFVFNKANGTVPRLNEGFMPGTSNHRISTVFRFKTEAVDEMINKAAYHMAGNGYVGIPSITELYSKLRDGTESEELSFSTGSLLCIKGKHISFDVSDELQGVFLTDGDNHEVRIDSFNRIGSNIIEAYIPEGMSAGTYGVKLVIKAGTERYETCVASKTIEVTA